MAALRWRHTHGSSITVLQRRYEEGLPVPASFLDQPQIAIHLRAEWAAFDELSTERQIGMGLGPIPRSKIIEYGRSDLLLRGDRLERFYQFMRALDADFLTMVNAAPETDHEITESAPVTDPAAVRRVVGGLSRPKSRRQGKQKP